MIKTGEFKDGKSTCDFCSAPASRVTEEGVALCAKHDKEKQIEKVAGCLNWKECPHA